MNHPVADLCYRIAHDRTSLDLHKVEIKLTLPNKMYDEFVLSMGTITMSGGQNINPLEIVSMTYMGVMVEREEM